MSEKNDDKHEFETLQKVARAFTGHLVSDPGVRGRFRVAAGNNDPAAVAKIVNDELGSTIKPGDVETVTILMREHLNNLGSFLTETWGDAIFHPLHVITGILGEAPP